jgi:3-oxoacyl-[acyl-carrier-protein] synthase II
MRRVVVTGAGGVTALGNDWPSIRARIEAGETATRTMADWDRLDGLNTRLAAPIADFDVDDRYPRKKLRTMGRVSRLATFASERALQDAGLLGAPELSKGRTGIAYGSSFGSTAPVVAFADLITKGTTRNLTATSYIQMMSHTAAVNIGLFFGLTGRIITTSSACTSGSQGIGYAYETIRHGLQDIMVAGGAEELCPSMAAVFDTLYATSTRNDQPETSPRPFDKDRDGLVIGEGAATLILEERDHALARGARVLAEIIGFGTNSDGNHVTQPQPETMQGALRLALQDAGLDAGAIGFVNGHGTATDWGDIAESQATEAVIGRATPFHTLKGHFGHSLGACGAIELWLAMAMMADGWFPATANLDVVDPRCAPLDYVMGEARRIDTEHLMSNNFAFGGINTSLIIRRA